MRKLSIKEKNEFKKMVDSSNLRKEMRIVERNRFNPFLTNGKVNADTVIDFITQCNDFFSHKNKPFYRIKDKLNKL